MTLPEFEIKFHFGTKRIKKRNVYIAALFLNLFVDLVSRFVKLKPTQLWALIDEIGRSFKIDLINELILQSPELLEERVERDTTKAVEDYKSVVEWNPVDMAEPTWIDDVDGETPLGGEMGFTYDFVVDLEEKPNEQR